jgi:uridine kinase
MIGDRVIPKPHHTKAAREVVALIKDDVLTRRAVLTVAGESGAGKSEIAVELARFLEDEGVRAYIFQQDDYFVRPPKTNDRARRSDIGLVGTQEVNLALLDDHVRAFRHSPGDVITKPLVIFDEDRISEETIAPSDFDVAIAEGTYTTLLDHADYHIFIDRSYVETKGHRQDRNRDPLDAFIERVLEIEHEIISNNKSRAHLIVNNDYSVAPVEK